MKFNKNFDELENHYFNNDMKDVILWSTEGIIQGWYDLEDQVFSCYDNTVIMKNLKRTLYYQLPTFSLNEIGQAKYIERIEFDYEYSGKLIPQKQKGAIIGWLPFEIFRDHKKQYFEYDYIYPFKPFDERYKKLIIVLDDNENYISAIWELNKEITKEQIKKPDYDIDYGFYIAYNGIKLLKEQWLECWFILDEVN